MRRTLLWLLCACIATTTATALADTPAAEAEALFNQGARAYQEGRYEDAVEAFLAAYAKDPHPLLFYNVAQAYERLGDVRNALRAYRDYLRHKPNEQDRNIVETRIRNLEKRLREQGIQQVSIFSTPSGAAILFDGKQVGTTPWTGEARPGRHSVVLRLSGHAEANKLLVLGPDRAVDLDVALVPLASASHSETSGTATPPSTSASTPADSGEEAGIRPWTWAALGVGAAALGGSLVFELLRRGAESDAEASTTQVEHVEHFQTMESRQTVARVLLGVGAAATVTGGVLLYFDLRQSGTADTAVAVGCSTLGCSVSGAGRF
jgi:tetratricopeptide (TPR) repeat protein